MRTIRFVFLCDPDERRKIQLLANHFQRSQGDAIRFLVNSAYHSLVHNLENPTEQLSWVSRGKGGGNSQL